MLDILFLVFLGVLFGVLTGLTPGLHPNTIIFTSMPFYFSLDVDFILYASFIAGISVSHTFHDFIPSIFLGVPEPDSALAALPGQKMALEGRGREAFVYTAYGAVYSLLPAMLLSFILFSHFKSLYSFFEPFMAQILLFVTLLIIFNSNQVLNSAIATVLSGLLGVFSFAAPVNQQYVLIPIFGGMFAFPSIWNALTEDDTIPEQFETQVEPMNYRVGGLMGFVASLPVVLFPGTSNSIATTFLYPILKSKERFISATGGVNTADIFLSFLTLMAMNKARSGASVVIQAVGKSGTALFVLGASIFAASISLPISFLTLNLFLKSKIYKKQNVLAVLVFFTIIIFVVVLTGWLGVLIFLTSASIGLFAASYGSRHACMAVLLVPAITFFSGSLGFI